MGMVEASKGTVVLKSLSESSCLGAFFLGNMVQVSFAEGAIENQSHTRRHRSKTKVIKQG